jgi:hypothetical protein
MDVVFAIIAGLFGYVGVGAVLARLALADLIKAATRQAGETYTEERYIQGSGESYASYHKVTLTRGENSVNRQVVYDTSHAIVFGWPVVFWWFYFNRDIRKALDKVDPPINRERIAELERDELPEPGTDLEHYVG